MIAAEDREWILPDLGNGLEGAYPAPGHLTVSAITGWINCPRCWAGENILQQPSPANVHFAVGAAIHDAIEIVGRNIIEGKEQLPPIEDVLAFASEAFDRSINSATNRNGTEVIPVDDAVAADAKQIALRTARFALPEFDRLYRERGVVACEYRLPESLNPFPFPFTGRVDAIHGGRHSTKPLMLSDTKTASAQRRPDQSNRIQGGVYALFIERSGQMPQVVFDTVTKGVRPSLQTYGLGMEGEPLMNRPQLMAVYELVVEVAEAISDGYMAYLNGDWRTYNRCFPIGAGWNGNHGADHGLPEAHPRLVVSFPVTSKEAS